ncbi:hypothetical protein CANCADRAFT_139664 [Tortispora caseinolytica NRRL Y-17796]|uniref:C2H2-type domain-containing protein n=1 Tax=Tortispora caseinolytica NRRL Y-17796 TaxID=767744 RepID=A0A1E4TCD5_9ASCO|nr:hypothetical protein CANCADRAFT_139664 [Tortispora caseinolytica NRRL Y-17796]
MEGTSTVAKKKRTSKSFKCTHPGCNKVFNRLDYLERHAMNHLAVRPFKCTICDLAFTRKDLLRKHTLSKSHMTRFNEIQRQQNIPPNGSTFAPPNSSSNVASNSSLSQTLGTATPADDFSRQNYSNSESYDDKLARTNSIPFPLARDSIPSQDEDLHQLFFDVTNDKTANQPPSNTPAVPNPYLDPQAENPALHFDISLADNYAWLFNDSAYDSSSTRSDDDPYKETKYSFSMNTPSIDPFSLPFADLPSDDIESDQILDFVDGGIVENEYYAPPIPLSQERLIDQSTADRIIKFLSVIPGVSDRLYLLDIPHLNSYLILYFEKFHALYPFLHLPTFYSYNTQSAVLVAMITIGMNYYEDTDAYYLAVAIHRRFRSIIIILIEDQPRVPLWIIQTLLLANYFDRMFGTNVQYDMAQVFHSSNVTLMRFSGYLSPMPTPQVDAKHDLNTLEMQWANWVEYESTKRAIFFMLISDTLHATLFKNPLSMSLFEVPFELPEHESLWNAASAQQFLSTKERILVNERRMSSSASSMDKQTHNSSFLSLLRRLINYGSFQKGTAIDYSSKLSPLSRLILLHGLLNIYWDMQHRGLLDIGLISDKRMELLSGKIKTAFQNWKASFDSYLSTNTFGTTLSSQSDLLYFINPICTLCWTSYQMGLTAMHSDSLTLRTYAGAPRVMGRAVRFDERKLSKRKVIEWCHSDDGRIAAWQAKEFFRVVLKVPSLLRLVSSLYWSLYICALTLWCYEFGHIDTLEESNKPRTTGTPAAASAKAAEFCTTLFRKYLLPDGNVNVSLARKDALAYIRIINVDNEEKLDVPKPDLETRTERAKLAVGLLTYTYSILKDVKWGTVGVGRSVIEQLLYGSYFAF